MRRMRSRATSRLAATALAVVVAAGCAGPSNIDEGEPMATPVPIAELIRRHGAEWVAREGVVGVYEGALPDGTPCIRVMVVRATPALREAFPDPFHGHPLQLRETGPIAPRDES